ncbi:hypothetical protein D3C76_1642370 [compost metagenome]
MNRHNELGVVPLGCLQRILRSHREVIPDWNERDINRMPFPDHLHIAEQAGVTGMQNS